MSTASSGVRRVVTGHRDGKAVFVSDGVVEPQTMALMPGSAFHLLWGGDQAPTFPDDGTEPAHPAYFPPVGGYRFGWFTVPPASTAPPEGVDIQAGIAEVEQKLPGLMSHMEQDNPGMHTTNTIDFEVVLSGEVVL